MNAKPHSFQTEIELLDFGRMAYRIIYLPQDMIDELPFDKFPRLRIDAEINDVPISGAWTPTAVGRKYLILSKAFCKDAEVKLGDSVEVRFAIADQEAVNIPDELLAEILVTQGAKAAWDALTPGKKRGLSYRVDSAKRDETREKRSVEVVSEILTQSRRRYIK